MGNKKWYQSLTIIASGVVVVLQALPGIIGELDKIAPQDLSADPRVIGALSATSALVAMYGRFRAKTEIK